jgi:hypothetical protein
LLRRECLDQMVMLNETHRRRLRRDYLAYYHRVRTHLSLAKDSPEPRAAQRSDMGRIVETPWSAASIIAAAGWPHKISPPAGCTGHPVAAGAGVRLAVGVFLPSRQPHRSPNGHGTRFIRTVLGCASPPTARRPSMSTRDG